MSYAEGTHISFRRVRGATQILEDGGMQHHHRAMVKRALEALSPINPNQYLARLTGKAKSTARSYRRDHRRPPVWVLECLLAELLQRKALIFALEEDLPRFIEARKNEIRRKTGFHEIKMRNGELRDGRGRGGRPKTSH